MTEKAPLGYAEGETVWARIASLTLREHDDYSLGHIELYVASRVLVPVVLKAGEIMAAPGRPIQYIWLYLPGIST